VTIYLELEEICAIHNAIEPAQPQIRDVGAIQSALGRPQATAFGEDAYATIWEKAPALLHSLACNRGWVEGNKRTAWVATMTFLEIKVTRSNRALTSTGRRSSWSLSRMAGSQPWPKSRPS